MAKRKSRQEERVELTPKEIARARRENKARRQMLIAIGAITAVVVVIMLVGLISELIVKPGQPVAEVNGVQITTKQFQERVRLQRAQTITLIEQYAQLFGVEQVSGIAAQLDDYEAVGEQTLDSMADELLVREAAGELGLSVSEEEVARFIEEQEGYYRDGTPTPLPTLTPRPTATPITSTETIATPLPTRTPFPTATAVTESGYEDLFREQLRALRNVGVGEAAFRQTVEFQLLLEKVRAELVKDDPTEAEQVELDVITFATEEEGNGYVAQLNEGDSFDLLLEQAREDAEDGITASVVSWTPVEQLGERWGAAAAQVAFLLGVGDHSNLVLTADGQYIMFRVTGHEVRELSASVLNTREETKFGEWLASLRETATIVKHDIWRDRVPKTPELNLATLIPTPSPSPETE